MQISYSAGRECFRLRRLCRLPDGRGKSYGAEDSQGFERVGSREVRFVRRGGCLFVRLPITRKELGNLRKPFKALCRACRLDGSRNADSASLNFGTFPARVDSGAAKTRKELGKTGKKQETEKLRFPKIRARKTRNNRERIKAKAEKRQ